jgi:hypothetical protein
MEAKSPIPYHFIVVSIASTMGGLQENVPRFKRRNETMAAGNDRRWIARRIQHATRKYQGEGTGVPIAGVGGFAGSSGIMMIIC